MTVMGQPSPFEKYKNEAWPYRFSGEVVVSRICGGTPSDEKTAEAWIRSKLKDTRSKTEIQAMVDELKNDLGNLDDAVKQAAKDLAGLNVFKRTQEGILHMEGRQLKAALKEGVSVAANAGKLTTKGWGKPDNAAYKKQIKGWFPEHVFVEQTELPMFRENGQPFKEPDGVLQKFVHTHRGDAIGYEEYCDNVTLKFTVKTDYEFSDRDWAMIWLTAQEQGVGASRSQGYGIYEVVKWEPLAVSRR